MSTSLKDEIELFHDKGVFLRTKTMKLTGDVDEDMLDLAMCNLHALDSVSGEVTIKLCSDGGDVAIARAIYDLILGMKNFVNIICYGEVSSSASLILQSGDKRIMSPNSKLMLHIGSESIPQDHPRNVDSLYRQHREDEKWMIDVYYKKMKEKKKRLTKSNISDILVFDKYYSPKEALEMGLIDEIGECQ